MGSLIENQTRFILDSNLKLLVIPIAFGKDFKKNQNGWAFIVDSAVNFCHLFFFQSSSETSD